MSERANPTVIGSFVIGALVLLAATVFALGGRSLLAERETVVCYFAGSLKGLEVGSAVRFRGVRLGRVSAIRAVFDPQQLEPEIPVYLELDLNSMLDPRDKSHSVQWDEVHERHVAAGLRAQLALDNLVTGSLYVALDYLPDTDLRLRGDGSVREIPTVQSNLEQLVETFQEIPFKRMFERAADLIDQLDELARTDAKRALGAIEGSMGSVESHLGELAGKVEQLLDEARALVARLDAQVDPLSRSTQAFLEDGRTAVQGLDGRLSELSDVLEQTLVELRDVARSMDERVALLADQTGGLVETADATLGGELTTLLVELERTARSVRGLAEALERRPEMLIGGKK